MHSVVLRMLWRQSRWDRIAELVAYVNTRTQTNAHNLEGWPTGVIRRFALISRSLLAWRHV